MDEIDLLILETLSFLEPMSKEMLILDFDNAKLKEFEHFDTDLLEARIEKLVKAKKIRKIKKDGEYLYQKLMPKRSWWQKIKYLLNLNN